MSCAVMLDVVTNIMGMLYLELHKQAAIAILSTSRCLDCNCKQVAPAHVKARSPEPHWLPIVMAQVQGSESSPFTKSLPF